ncbi:MAG: methionyl-tRNA formyltransferase [Gammaproteobacteria bacterium]|nr:methionyl-tRNA formyltransferase [Gammaproteobacteria bacterium]
MSALRIVFAGTPEFAAAHLNSILNSSHEVIAVYTQPDRPSGRGIKLLPSPVKELALANNLPVNQPASLRNEDEHRLLESYSADALIVVAYGLILPREILAVPRFGCINVHASLLPRWRGAAPIERALLAGDKVSGITVMQMDEGLDTGDILLKSEVSIDDSNTRNDLESKLTEVGCEALIKALNNLEELLKTPEKQDDSQSCYAGKLDKAEALINWSQSAELIERQIRVGIGRFPAYSFFNSERIRILKAQVSNTTSDLSPGTIIESNKDSFTVRCGTGSIAITQIQLPGKNVVAVRDITNSKPSFFTANKKFTASDETT